MLVECLEACFCMVCNVYGERSPLLAHHPLRWHTKKLQDYVKLLLLSKSILWQLCFQHAEVNLRHILSSDSKVILFCTCCGGWLVAVGTHRVAVTDYFVPAHLWLCRCIYFRRKATEVRVRFRCCDGLSLSHKETHVFCLIAVCTRCPHAGGHALTALTALRWLSIWLRLFWHIMHIWSIGWLAS
jgi:hypothetical protein